jgi:hypothetical protein
VICLLVINGLKASKLATAASADLSLAAFALYGHAIGLSVISLFLSFFASF